MTATMPKATPITALASVGPNVRRFRESDSYAMNNTIAGHQWDAGGVWFTDWDMKNLTALAAVAALLCACTPAAQDSPRPAPTSTVAAPTSTPAPTPQEVRATAASLLIVGVRDYADAAWALKQGVGGIFIGVDTDPALFDAIGALRNEVGREFDVAIDFEGGRVQRHANVLLGPEAAAAGGIPSPRQQAATMSLEQVRAMAADLGRRLAEHGVTINFAPVVDLDGADLDVVGDRSYSDDPAITADYARAFAQGMLDAGVQPVFKHFPGHGRASGDSHSGEVITPPLSELENLDLRPYGDDLLIPGAGVMMGHMVVPGLAELQAASASGELNVEPVPANTPASLNPNAYALLRTGTYRDGEPFEGRVYTDDLSGMRAISNLMPIEQAVATSIQAGADRALWVSTQGLEPAIDAVVAKVDAGEIPYSQLVASAERI